MAALSIDQMLRKIHDKKPSTLNQRFSDAQVKALYAQLFPAAQQSAQQQPAQAVPAETTPAQTVPAQTTPAQTQPAQATRKTPSSGKTLDQILRSIHTKNPKTLNKRYTEAEARALYDKMFAPTSQEPAQPGEQTPGETTPGEPTPGEEKVTVDTNLKDGEGYFKDPSEILAQMPEVPGSTDLSGDVQAARDAAYGYITKDYAANKAQEMEEMKSELANRGVIYDPGNPQGLWGRSIGSIDKKYQSLDDAAKMQAIGAGNTILGTESQVGATAADTFLKAVLGMSDADLTKYGIDKDYVTKIKQIQASKQIAASKGGGGGGGSTDAIIGGTAPGFNV